MQNTSFEDFDDLLNNASLGVHLVASDGKILWANDLELQLLGYEREEYVNRHVVALFTAIQALPKRGNRDPACSLYR